MTALLAGRAPALGRLVRRAPPPLRPRRPARAPARAGEQLARAATQSQSLRPAARARARAAGRRRPRLPGRRLGGPVRAAAARSSRDEPTEEHAATLFDVAAPSTGEYVLPDRACCRRRPPAARGRQADRPAHGRHARRDARALRRRGDDRRPDRRAARDALRAPARARDEGVEGRRAQGRPLLRARDDRDPHPRADPGQAGGRRRGAEPGAEDRHARRHLRRPARRRASPLAVWLGKDISGNAVWTDLARMPHLLIAGTTGSGKSGCINTILTSILLRSTPDEVRMILIDPKRIELNYYESIPHLLTPVVSSPKEASAVLANVVAEMERRYERLSLVRARNLPEANRAFRARGRGHAAVPARRDRRARRPDDDQPAGGRGRGHPARAEVARRRHPPRARDAAAVGGRDHRDDQGERALPDRLRGLDPDRLARDPRHRRRREPARPGRHALQAARHLAAAARPGRVRDRGGGRARRRAVPPPARAGARRDAARGARGRCPTTRTSTTATSTRTRIRCSTRRSRSSCRRRPRPSR